MARGFIVSIAVLCCSMSARASQPGQPLDCSDWVLLEPGYSCRTIVPFPCGAGQASGPDANCLAVANNKALDNAGRILRIRSSVPTGSTCGVVDLTRLELRAFDGTSDQLIGYVSDRCIDSSFSMIDRVNADYAVYHGDIRDGGVMFDPVRGSLSLVMVSDCATRAPGVCPYGGGSSLVSIEGFTPTFEIAQTYDPEFSGFAFRVPVRPEGLLKADHFDTYWGYVSDLPAFTAAHSLQCGYPAAPPQVGDFLSVGDTSPLPAPGQANYIVTAVTSGAQRRYGRKLAGGVLSGRDPALLPACTEEAKE